MRSLSLLFLTLFSFLSVHQAEAQTTPSTAHVCASAAPVADTGGNIFEIELDNSCQYPVAVYFCSAVFSNGSSLPPPPCVFNTYLINGKSFTLVPDSILGQSANLFLKECPATFTTETGSFSSNGVPPPCSTVTASNVVGAVLPNAFAVQDGKTATVFATIQSTGSGTGVNCRIALPGPVVSQFTFQQTNPSTNTLIGQPNTPVNIGTGSATFELTFISLTTEVLTAQQLVYSCDGAPPAPSIAGLSSIDMNFTAGPTANVVAEAVTPSKNGTLTIPINGDNAFAVATDNTGNASGSVTVSVDTGNTSLPLTLSLCQTNPSTGACLATPTASLAATIAVGAQPTFSVFAVASGNIPFSPATNRVFVRFKVGGLEVGATSVAVQT